MKIFAALLLVVVGTTCLPPQHIEDPDRMDNFEIVTFPTEKTTTKNETTTSSVVPKTEAIGSGASASLIETERVAAIVEICAGVFTLLMLIAGAIAAFLKFRARAQGDGNDVHHYHAYAIALMTLLARMRRRQR